MDAAAILEGLGFAGAEVVNTVRNQGKEKVVVKVRTSKGWVYQKFEANRLEEEIAAWARFAEPA